MRHLFASLTSRLVLTVVALVVLVAVLIGAAATAALNAQLNHQIDDDLQARRAVPDPAPTVPGRRAAARTSRARTTARATSTTLAAAARRPWSRTSTRPARATGTIVGFPPEQLSGL